MMLCVILIALLVVKMTLSNALNVVLVNIGRLLLYVGVKKVIMIMKEEILIVKNAQISVYSGK